MPAPGEAAPETARRWNDQWWQKVVKQKKTALPTIHNVRPKKAKKK